MTHTKESVFDFSLNFLSCICGCVVAFVCVCFCVCRVYVYIDVCVRLVCHVCVSVFNFLRLRLRLCLRLRLLLRLSCLHRSLHETNMPCLCACVCVYVVCVFTFVYVCVCVCRVCVCVRLGCRVKYTDRAKYTNINANWHCACTHSIHQQLLASLGVYVCVYSHTHTHTHTRTYIQTDWHCTCADPTYPQRLASLGVCVHSYTHTCHTYTYVRTNVLTYVRIDNMRAQTPPFTNGWRPWSRRRQVEILEFSKSQPATRCLNVKLLVELIFENLAR